MKKILRSKKGFTLLELIMVVIIIGILATLAIPQYTRFAEKARAAEAINTIGAIKTAQAMYKLEDGVTYTSTIGDLDIDVPTSGTATLWTYGCSGGAATGFVATATRTTKDAAAADVGDTIILTWVDATGEAWSGTHSGVPN